MTRVIVHIDRLVLKGFRHEDRYAIATGLQKELGRVFADREAVRSLTAAGDVSRLQLGCVHVGHGSNPQRAGANVARGISKETKK